MAIKRGILFLMSILTGTLFAAQFTSAQKAALARRCFVWNPAACTAKNKLADEKLLKSLTLKLTPTQAAEKILTEAWDSLQNQQDPITALYRFNQSLLLEMSNERAWWGAGESFLNLEMPRDAQPLLQKAITLNERLAPAHAALSKCFLQQSKIGEARTEYALAKKFGYPPDLELEKKIK